MDRRCVDGIGDDEAWGLGLAMIDLVGLGNELAVLAAVI
jgi:hypothetical protein